MELDFFLDWVLIPGYAIALILTRFVPPVITGIAFDSGGVASGPMTSSFLLPLAMGACLASGGNIVTDAFGIVALVALAPLIAVQLMGLVYVRKSKEKTKVSELSPEDDRKKLETILTSYRVPIFFQLRGKGTVPSKMIDMFGLGNVTRLVTVGVMLSGSTHELLRDLDVEIQVRRKGRGILFTIPVTGLQNPVLGLLRSSDRDYYEKEIGERVENDKAQVNERGKYMAVIAVVD